MSLFVLTLFSDSHIYFIFLELTEIYVLHNTIIKKIKTKILGKIFLTLCLCSRFPRPPSASMIDQGSQNSEEPLYVWLYFITVKK